MTISHPSHHAPHGGLRGKPAPTKRRSYVRIDPRFLRVCTTCKRKNARVQLIHMTRTPLGPLRLDRSSVKVGHGVNVCDRKACIAKALEKKHYDYWVKVPIGQDFHAAVISR